MRRSAPLYMFLLPLLGGGLCGCGDRALTASSDVQSPPTASAPDAQSDMGEGPDEPDTPTVTEDAEQATDGTGPPAPQDAAPEPELTEDVMDATEPPVPQDAGPEPTEDVNEDTGSGDDAGPVFDPESTPVDSAQFPLGVQAADATAEAVILATWNEPNTSMTAIVWRTEDLVIAWEGDLTTDKEGHGHIEAVGLAAATEYHYTFVPVNASYRSPTGRFLTAPSLDAMPPLVFGATSCINMPNFEGISMTRAGEAELDLFILAGDTVYADGADDLDDYREHWIETYETEPLRTLRASTSVLATWDDHEVGNNWNPESTDAAKIEAARSAFFEFSSARVDPAHPDRIWRSVSWGQTAEFFLLDCRSERKPSTKDTAEAEYLSPDQLGWLQAMLLSSEAVFKVVVNSVAFTKMPWTFPSADDRWQGYEAQRELLLQTLENIDGVLFISGDFHFGAVMRIEAPPHPLDYVHEVLAGPSAQFPNPGVLLIDNGFFESQVPFTTGTNNYTRFTADPWADPPEITVDFVAGDGDVFHTQTLWF